MDLNDRNYESDINIELARRAYYNVSHRPDKRGDSAIGHYREVIASIAAALQKQCVSEAQQAIAQDIFDELHGRFKRLFMDWLAAQSRCLSSMITGPARFPVARAEKANRSEHQKMQRVLWFGNNVDKMIAKRLRKLVSPQEAIALEVERLEKRISAAQRDQDFMKAANKAYRAWVKKPSDELNIFHGFSAAQAEAVKNWKPRYSFGKAPYAPYQMQNNLANIKRMQGRLAELKAKQQRAESAGSKAYAIGGIMVVENFEQDRLQLFFDGKPEQEVREALKAHGYRWAPSCAAWQRKLTGNAIYSLKNHLLACEPIKRLAEGV